MVVYDIEIVAEQAKQMEINLVVHAQLELVDRKSVDLTYMHSYWCCCQQQS